jgi:hypothetical protein
VKREEFKVQGCYGVGVGVGVLVDDRRGPERQSLGDCRVGVLSGPPTGVPLCLRCGRGGQCRGALFGSGAIIDKVLVGATVK